MRWLQIASLLVGAIGIGWVGLIFVAGRAAQRDRHLLLVIFKPGVYLTIGLVALLMLAHAGILFAAALTVMRSAPWLLAKLVGLVGLAALTGAYAMVRQAFAAVQSQPMFRVGRAVSRDEAPRLWSRVDSIAARLGTAPPDQILVGPTAEFFVIESEVQTPDGEYNGRTLFCSLSFARILSERELESIIGHELAHFSGEDTQYSERFYPIYHRTAVAHETLHARGNGGIGMVALLPAVTLLELFMEAFAIAANRLSRERELIADAAGARVTDARVAASALVKAHAFSGAWAGTQNASLELLREGRMFENMSEVFTTAVHQHSTPAMLEGLDERTLAHPTDSHPPLAARLASLGITMASVERDALTTTPEHPADKLFEDGEGLERSLSEAYQLALAGAAQLTLAEEAGPASAEPAAQA